MGGRPESLEAAPLTLRREIDVGNAARHNAALNELRAIREPGAIPGLESVFANCDAETGGAVIAAISGVRGQRATDSLIRFALFAPTPEVGIFAAEA